MAANLGVAIGQNKDKAFLTSVENDGFTVEEYPCNVFGVNNFKGCFSFILKKNLYFCIRKTIHQFSPASRKWERLTSGMEVVRYGTSCVSLKQGTIIAGGCESVDGRDPKLTDSCTLIREEEGNLVTINVGKLPKKIKYHTMTKLSNDKFILCGGMDSRGEEIREVYMGTLINSQPHTQQPPTSVTSYSGFEPTNGEVYVDWTKLPNMRQQRSGHFAMFVNNRIYVIGGGHIRDKKDHFIEMNLVECGLEFGSNAGMIIESLPLTIKDDIGQYTSGKWETVVMGYDISHSDLVLSPNKKYGIIAGGEIYCFGKYGGYLEEEHFYLTMNTKSLFMRSLGEDTHSLHTNKIWRIILSFNCLTPMYDDIDSEYGTYDH